MQNKFAVKKFLFTWHISYIKCNDIAESSYIREVPDYVFNLCNILLSIDGEVVAVYQEAPEMCIPINDYGNLLIPKSIVLEKQADEDSHSNCCKIWKNNPFDFRIATGFTLKVNRWERHTWLLNNENQIIETIEKKDKYFGWIMDDNEANLYYDINCVSY